MSIKKMNVREAAFCPLVADHCGMSCSAGVVTLTGTHKSFDDPFSHVEGGIRSIAPCERGAAYNIVSWGMHSRIQIGHGLSDVHIGHSWILRTT